MLRLQQTATDHELRGSIDAINETLAPAQPSRDHARDVHIPGARDS
jgi:hypothetical protein